MNLQDIRREYLMGGLRRADLADDPHEQFATWMKQAFEMEVVDPSAMTLATVDGAGKPSQRIVLLKDCDGEGFVFFTNYASHKGCDLDVNPNASLHFPWHAIERQVQIRGEVEKISEDESRLYFYSRPRGSQLAAAISSQSSVVESRAVLEEAFDALDKKSEGKEVPFPASWGGYRLRASQIEFWQGGANRLHNRFRYTREGDKWLIERLSP